MSLEIKVGPPQLAIHHGTSVLVTELNGEIVWPSDKGLYFRDTRMMSSWTIFANGVPWELLNGAAMTHFAARVFLTNRPILTEDGLIPEHTLSLVVSRSIDGGMHEDLDITNYGMAPIRFNLELAIRSDFADIFEVKQDRIVRRGRITTEWSPEKQRLETAYGNKDFDRSLIVTPHQTKSAASYANGRLTFDVCLAPGETWHSCLLYDMADAGKIIAAPMECTDHGQSSRLGRELADWKQRVLVAHSSNVDFDLLFHQAIDDMAALRFHVDGPDGPAVIPAAGLPWFVALFGRDSLLFSHQALLVQDDFARGTLAVLGSWQARERDDYRDAEPGKILHELRQGELAHFKMIPHTPYYGTADATPLYLILLHAAWRVTGEESLLKRHLDTAERCLEWIDIYGDRDGDGFQEFETRSKDGYANQGWKDSGDSLRHTDGTLAKGPKALCELQGYVFDAWQRMAEVFEALGRTEDARALREKARVLQQRFDEAFWDESEGFYAHALDGEKRPVMSVVSNAGHCLWSGIVKRERAGRVVDRLMQPDMYSGWGIRTLSSKHPAYNPYSYQNGSVWPHDNSMAAIGMRRYGYGRQAARVAQDVAEAGSFFTLNQLPELYAGIQREESSFPVQVLGANVPQAWAAGSVFSMTQMLLGIHADAPRKRILVDPLLPDWLPDMTLSKLAVGGQDFKLLFWRTENGAQCEVLEGDKSWVVQHSADTGSDLPGVESTGLPAGA